MALGQILSPEVVRELYKLPPEQREALIAELLTSKSRIEDTGSDKYVFTPGKEGSLVSLPEQQNPILGAYNQQVQSKGLYDESFPTEMLNNPNMDRRNKAKVINNISGTGKY